MPRHSYSYTEFKAYKIRTARRYIDGARDATKRGNRSRAAWCLHMAKVVRQSIRH